MQPSAARALVVRAPIWARLVAFLLDGAILSVVNLGLTALVGDTRLEERATFALLLVVTAVYHVGFVAFRSTTPGKIAMGLLITDRDGKPVEPDTAILRYIVLLVGNLILVGLVISLVLMLTDERRRSLHDRVAGTLVVIRPPESEADPST